MPDILAIVSKAVFEKDARVALKDIWPVDRYNTTSKTLDRLKDGGRIFLVTVRPPNERLWFLGAVESPKWNGSSWVSKSANSLPVTDISHLRKTLKFESGNGLSQDKGTLGMSLQTARSLTANDVAQILGAVTGTVVATTLASAGNAQTKPASRPSRIIGGKYEIISKLGQGGMGTVYEARHTGAGRHVAVKEVKEIAGNDSSRGGDGKQIIERFEREARATGAIDSQHIAVVLDSGTDPETSHPYLVMELLKGEDLQQLLARTGPLPEDVALRIAAQAAMGLLRAHEAGVVHRDIKPANIFLARRDGGDVVVKLLDFGIARVKEQLQSPENPALTSTGLMLGTPLYMSPEQALGPKNIDARSDLWSLGVVLYEMLTGRTPHDVETVGALILAICTKPAPALETVREPVRDLVKRLLQIDAKLRHESAGELLAAFKAELTNGTTLDETMLAIERKNDSVSMQLAKTELKSS